MSSFPPFTSACLSTVDLTVGAIGELKEGVEVEEDGEDDHQDHISPAPPHVVLEKAFKGKEQPT